MRIEKKEIRQQLEQLVEEAPVSESRKGRPLMEFSDEVTSDLLNSGADPRVLGQDFRINVLEIYSKSLFYLALSHAPRRISSRWEDCTASKYFDSAVREIVYGIRKLNGCFPAAGEIIWEKAKRKVLNQGIPFEQVRSEESIILSSILIKVDHKEFAEYCGKQGISSVCPAHQFSGFNCAAAAECRRDYDLGVGIANGGMYASYMMHQAGLPVMTVEMKRKGRGATWQPKTFIGEKLTGKKVLVIENDIVTGRTMRRAVREIMKYSPSEISACFMEGPDLCRLQNLPGCIVDTHHIIAGKEPNWEEDIEWTQRVAQRYDEKYDIVR